MSYNDLRKGRFSEVGREYFVTCVVRSRRPIFQDFHACRLLVEEMRAMEVERRLRWLAWVIMPDHIHGLVSLQTPDLSRQLHLFKGRSSRRLGKLLGMGGGIWQPGFYDHALRKEEDRRAVARYIVANPLRAGLVASVGDYPHWDSVWV